LQELKIAGDVTKEIAKFISQVFGPLLEDSVGLVSDRLKYFRAEKLALLHQKTKKRLQESGITKTVNVPPKVGIPLIEIASLEDDDELHTKWSNMLSNAMNPNNNQPITRSYVSILSELNALDAYIINVVASEYAKLDNEKKQTVLFARAKLTETLHYPEKEIEISLRNMMRLGCIKAGVVEGGLSIGDHRLSSYKDTELFQISELGLAFHESIS